MNPEHLVSIKWATSPWRLLQEIQGYIYKRDISEDRELPKSRKRRQEEYGLQVYNLRSWETAESTVDREEGKERSHEIPGSLITWTERNECSGRRKQSKERIQYLISTVYDLNNEVVSTATVTRPTNAGRWNRYIKAINEHGISNHLNSRKKASRNFCEKLGSRWKNTRMLLESNNWCHLKQTKCICCSRWLQLLL